MKKILLTLFILCSFSVYAQNNAAEGFIVKISGDTIHGFIRERFEWTNATFIEISSSPSDASKKISLLEVDNFYLKKYNSYYFRRILEVDKKPIELSQLERTPDQKMQMDTVIIRMLLKGELNLYDYVDENAKKHFFIQRGNEKIEELGFVKYLDSGLSTNVFNSGINNQVTYGSVVMEKPLFVETLKKYFVVNCSKVGSISYTYEEKPIKDMIRKYNSCFTKGTQEFSETDDKGSLSVNVFAGGGVAFANYKGNAQQNNSSTPDPNKADFKATSVVSLGVHLDYIPARKSRFTTGLQIGYVKTGTAKAEQKLVTRRQSLSMSFSMVTAGVRIKYIFAENNNANFYGALAGGVQRIISSTSDYTSTDLSLNKSSEGQFTQYKDFGYFYSLAVGSKFKRVFTEIGFRPIISTEVKRKTAVPGNPTTEGRAVLSILDISVGWQLTKK